MNKTIIVTKVGFGEDISLTRSIDTTSLPIRDLFLDYPVALMLKHV